MKILVIGGTGFIGARIVDRLLHRGAELCLVHRGNTPAVRAGEVWEILADRSDLDRHYAKIGDWSPECIIDTIAYTTADAWSLLRLLEHIPAARAVLLSSGDVYRAYDCFLGRAEGIEESPIAEEAPLRAKLFPYRGEESEGDKFDALAYHYDKIPVEFMLRGSSAPTTILRLPAVYGEGDPHDKLGQYLNPMLRGDDELWVDREKASWRWSRSYVENLAEDIAEAAWSVKDAFETFNLGPETSPTEMEWIEKLKDISGWEGRVVVKDKRELPESQRESGRFVQDMYLDASKWRHSSYRPDRLYDREEALKRWVAHKRDNFSPEN
ncbi:MAG: NAD-dependent epimerase/dehydratase family protein [Saprospiraceae bacterium]|nr:NAD-dependent epimerase/dehydratase family protein [Saprospiraceae bacterium]